MDGGIEKMNATTEDGQDGQDYRDYKIEIG